MKLCSRDRITNELSYLTIRISSGYYIVKGKSILTILIVHFLAEYTAVVMVLKEQTFFLNGNFYFFIYLFIYF